MIRYNMNKTHQQTVQYFLDCCIKNLGCKSGIVLTSALQQYNKMFYKEKQILMVIKLIYIITEVIPKDCEKNLKKN